MLIFFINVTTAISCFKVNSNTWNSIYVHYILLDFLQVFIFGVKKKKKLLRIETPSIFPLTLNLSHK